MATHVIRSSHLLEDTPAASPKPSLLRRLTIAILVSQMRRAQREIDRACRGGPPLQR